MVGLCLRFQASWWPSWASALHRQACGTTSSDLRPALQQTFSRPISASNSNRMADMVESDRCINASLCGARDGVSSLFQQRYTWTLLGGAGLLLWIRAPFPIFVAFSSFTVSSVVSLMESAIPWASLNVSLTAMGTSMICFCLLRTGAFMREVLSPEMYCMYANIAAMFIGSAVRLSILGIGIVVAAAQTMFRVRGLLALL